MSAHSDIGPSLPPRWKVYQQARELYQLVQLAMDCSVEGPRADVPRAVAALDRMRMILDGEAG